MAGGEEREPGSCPEEKREQAEGPQSGPAPAGEAPRGGGFPEDPDLRPRGGLQKPRERPGDSREPRITIYRKEKERKT